MSARAPDIDVSPGFHIGPQDPFLKPGHEPPTAPGPPAPAPPPPAPPPLGVLENFKGKFAGTGLNMIFRPNSGETTFDVALNPPLTKPSVPPNENLLELNLTAESLVFQSPLGNVPNRGLEKQTDIFLNGVHYVQAINDVTNLDTGKGDAEVTPDRGIHFEPGLWMHVPATTINPNRKESLTRMASIPHGTTINAQCLAPIGSSPKPPPFTGPNALPAVDITPFPIGQPGNRIRFVAQTAAAANTPRLPQDLSKFIAAGTITQAILDNPNVVLANAIKGQTITKTIVFTVATSPVAPFLAGGTANIDFLVGSPAGTGGVNAQSGPNASAVEMTATFWIETVQVSIEAPAMKQGDPPKLVSVPPASPGAQPGPKFRVAPPKDIPKATAITVSYTQIQYMQNVFLNFAGLTWPHVSCATLVPASPIPVPDAAFG